MTAPDDGRLLHPMLTEDYRGRLRATARLRDDAQTFGPRRRDHFTAALAAVAAGRSRLIQLHRTGRIHDSTLQALEAELDLDELHLKRLGGLNEP